MLKKEEILSGLAQCYGSMNLFKNKILCFEYTDGVKFLWESCDAYWLLIAIASYRRKEEFQIWELKVDNGSAVLTMKEDSNRRAKVRQEIPLTDFPLDGIKLYLENGVLCLPSER